MKLNRILIIFLLALLHLTVPQIAYANSGPTYWKGYPSSEVLAVDRNCPIKVESEKLSFDLSDDNGYDNTIWGKVQASYEMVNPTNQETSVKMAFPFVSSLYGLSRNDIAITADGISLDYEIFIGDIVNSYPYEDESSTDFSFDKIVSTITKEPYKAENFSETETGKLHMINVKPTTEERINFAVSFSLDENKSKVLTNGFNRYERRDSNIRIAAWCYEPETLEIFVLGEDILFDIAVYTDGELSKTTENYTYDIKIKTVELKSYLLRISEEFRQEYMEQRGMEEWPAYNFSDDKLYNLYGRALDRTFNANDGYSAFDDVLNQNYSERIFTLVYDANFPANSKKNVTVSYKAKGTMDRRRTQGPVYTFNYITNPAENWADFGTLDIEIITPEKAPYIIDSSIELTKEKDRLYRANLDSLPQQDLVFSVYENEKIRLFDKAFANPYASLLLFMIFGIIILAVLIIAVVHLVKRIRASKN